MTVAQMPLHNATVIYGGWNWKSDVIHGIRRREFMQKQTNENLYGSSTVKITADEVMQFALQPRTQRHMNATAAVESNNVIHLTDSIVLARVYWMCIVYTLLTM